MGGGLLPSKWLGKGMGVCRVTPSKRAVQPLLKGIRLDPNRFVGLGLSGLDPFGGGRPPQLRGGELLPYRIEPTLWATCGSTSEAAQSDSTSDRKPTTFVLVEDPPPPTLAQHSGGATLVVCPHAPPPPPKLTRL